MTDIKQKVEDAAKRAKSLVRRKAQSATLVAATAATTIAGVVPQEAAAQDTVRVNPNVTIVVDDEGVRVTDTNANKSIHFYGNEGTVAQTSPSAATEQDIAFLQSFTPEQLAIYRNLNDYAKNEILTYHYRPAPLVYQTGLNPYGETGAVSRYAVAVEDHANPGNLAFVAVAPAYYQGSSTNPTPIKPIINVTPRQALLNQQKHTGAYQDTRRIRNFAKSVYPVRRQIEDKMNSASREIDRATRTVDRMNRSVDRARKRIDKSLDGWIKQGRIHRR